MRFGIVGAGLSWLIVMLGTTAPFMVLLHRRFLPGELRNWLLGDLLRPLLATLPVVLLARLLVPAPSSRLLTMGLIGTVCGMAVLAAGCSVPELRAEFIARTRGLFWRSYAHQ
jgi:hypothetical protein